MSDLVDFLRARLDEDEAVAQEARKWTDRDWTTSLDERGDGWVSADNADPIVVTIGPADAPAAAVVEHIARWDPARVLAEVAAKRAIFDLHADVESTPDWLVALTQPYADHPDFDPSWRPVIAP